MSDRDLEGLYADARAALKAKEFDRASGLLRQVLAADENYKDASRLLAQAVRLKRRRWYNDPRLWVALVVVIVLGVAIYVVPRFPAATAAATSVPTAASGVGPAVTTTEIPAATASALKWKRVGVGQEFARDMVQAIVIDRSDPDVLYVRMRTAGTFRSIDGGASWQPVENADLDGEVFRELSIDPLHDISTNFEMPDGSTRVYIYWDSSVRSSAPDGSNQLRHGDPGIGKVASALLLPSSDPNLIYVAGIGVAVTRDGGTTWTSLNNGLGAQKLQLVSSGGEAAGLFGLLGDCFEPDNMRDDLEQPLYHSSDGGRTWMFVRQTGCELITDADGTTFYRVGHFTWLSDIAGRGWIWRSSDGGKTWEKSWTLERKVALAADPQQSGRLLLQGERAFSERNPQFISEDYGRSWERVEPAVITRPCHGSTVHFLDRFRPMVIDPFDADHVLYIQEGELTESRNSCEGTTRSPSAPATDLMTVAFGRRQAGVLYAGGSSGAYVSEDGGATWSQINEGLLGATVVYSIVVDADGSAFAATPYGIFTLEGE